jgi:hypothetical protein
LIGCTKQNGDAARKGCIAVLLVWFDLPVLVVALLRLAAQLVRVALAEILWLDFWISGLRTPERIFLIVRSCRGLAGHRPSWRASIRFYSYLFACIRA